MSDHNRLIHLKGVFGKWWWGVNSAWGLISSADVLVGHYASASFRASWDATWIAPKWGWEIWIIGVLLITAIAAFEYSFRYIKFNERAAKTAQTILQSDLDQEIAKRRRPELVASLRRMGNPLVTMLELRNTSPVAAVNIRIEDVTYKDRTLRFSPPASIINSSAPTLVSCKILYNSTAREDDLGALFEYMGAMQQSLGGGKLQLLEVLISYSNLDDRALQRRWMLSFSFWYDYYNKSIEMGGQKIEEVT